ncbi:MAG: hypothetical protein AAFW46_17730 [Pseudomonadota bacterium]
MQTAQRPRLSEQGPAIAGTAAILAFPTPMRAAPRLEAPLTGAEARRLDRLRRVARDSCLAARRDRPGAPGVHWDSPPFAIRSRCAELFRAFLEAADRDVRVHRPEASAIGVDERWLLRLFSALAEDDLARAKGLVAFRVARHRRRETLAMAARLAAVLALDPPNAAPT